MVQSDVFFFLTEVDLDYHFDAPSILQSRRISSIFILCYKTICVGLCVCELSCMITESCIIVFTAVGITTYNTGRKTMESKL